MTAFRNAVAAKVRTAKNSDDLATLISQLVARIEHASALRAVVQDLPETTLGCVSKAEVLRQIDEYIVR